MRLLFLIALCQCLVQAGLRAESLFNRDVRPILSKNCYACHGPDANERKAKLRLDTAEGAAAGGKSGKPAVVPGKISESELWRRIASTDPDEIMPPPEAHRPLNAADRNTIREWIESGARFAGHWAYIPPEKAALPDGPDDNPIDRFVRDRLQKEGLDFSPQADRRTLCRRLHFDLTGLPPEPGAVKAFLHDDKPGAVERLVEGLLDSPHFGERMALPWLDAARYADTNGYSIDGGRHAWLWRDWVIKAFNDNKPYDAFLLEQLAGDLMENADETKLIATAFNRHNAVTHEGGTIPEENLVNYVSDRVKTVGESILGLTTGCAQCHDHKYDPITQEEYYQLFAFFNTADDIGLDGNNGVNPRPHIKAGSPLATEEEIAAVKREMTRARKALRKVDPSAQAEWEKDACNELARAGTGFELVPLDHLTATLPNGNPFRVAVNDDESVTVKHGDFSAYNVCCRIPDGTGLIHGVRIVFEPAANSQPGFGNGKKTKGTFVLNTATTCFSPFAAKNIDLDSAVSIGKVSASSHLPGFEPTLIHDTRRSNGWAPVPAGKPEHITLTFAKPVNPVDNPFLTTELVFNYGENASPARFRIYGFHGVDDDTLYPTEIGVILKTEPDRRSAEAANLLERYFIEHSPFKACHRMRLHNLEERLEILTGKHSIMVMNTSAKPRRTRFLERGLYSAPAHEVKPGVPAFLPPLKKIGADGEASRLDFARWLLRDDHPLTARVAVNRIWQALFGTGLVASSADFGSQGEWPTHPELLDWLAVDFRESGWNTKSLIKRIVTSRTYLQSSDTNAALLDRDPDNRLLSRGARFRLPAELLRDNALSVAGLLVPRLGGPSVKPYQPGDLWRQVSHYGSTPATAQTYVQDHGEKLYRRSLYTYWKRTLPPPDMAVFDAPSREICITNRGRTNTPLQSLVLLNSDQLVEAARVLAMRMLSMSLADDNARLASTFERVTSRPPTRGELRLLHDALQREHDHFNKNPTAAEDLLAIGESEQVSKTNLPEHAAWTNVCLTLLNLSETITRR